MNKEYIQKVKNRKDIIYISTTEEDKENMIEGSGVRHVQGIGFSEARESFHLAWLELGTTGDFWAVSWSEESTKRGM